jgi:autophagy-related protein 9
MRKDNYLIAMINKGVVDPGLPLPRWTGCRRRASLLTKTLEWNLRWCILDHMFDERTFRVKRELLGDPSRLEKSEEG